MNPKATTKIMEQKVICNKSKKEIKWNHEKYLIQKKVDKEEKEQRMDEMNRKNNRLFDLNISILKSY